MNLQQTSAFVTFFEEEEDVQYDFDLSIGSDNWVTIIVTRFDLRLSYSGRTVQRANFPLSDFTTWNQTDPMLNPPGINGILLYCNKVLQFPEWINKFQLSF